MSCGAPPEKLRQLRISSGLNLLVFRYARWTFVPLPLCSRCDFRRMLGSVVVAPAAFLALIVIGAVATAARASEHISPSTQLIVIALVLLAIVLLANLGEQWLNDWLLGVRGVSFSEEGESVTLQFRTDERARRLLDANPLARVERAAL